MDILQVRYFSKVYETLNYAHAAEQLYVSRQALRKVIHNVEREVGQPLFRNVANQLQATPAADRLYEISRGAVRGFGELEDGLASMKLARAGILRVGFTYDSNAVFSRSEHEAFVSLPGSHHPVDPASLRSRTGSKDEILRLLLRGDLDYAHVLGCTFDRSLFDCQVARTGRLHLIVHLSSPLAARGSVSIDDLAGVGVSIPTEGNDIAELLVTQARLHGFELQVIRYDPSLHRRLVTGVHGAHGPRGDVRRAPVRLRVRRPCRLWCPGRRGARRRDRTRVAARSRGLGAHRLGRRLSGARARSRLACNIYKRRRKGGRAGPVVRPSSLAPIVRSVFARARRL